MPQGSHAHTVAKPSFLQPHRELYKTVHTPPTHPPGSSYPKAEVQDMGPGKGLLLCSLLLLAPGGLRLCSGQVRLTGFVGESVHFPALRPVARDIVRILWFSGRLGTHIAEAKPQGQVFSSSYVPYFSNRLAIHASNLSLELRQLRLEDQGPYHAVVDIASDPTNPRTFNYVLSVRGRRQEGGRTEGFTGPPAGEWMTTSPTAGREPVTTEGKGGRATPAGGDAGDRGGGRSWCSCHCSLKGYLITAIYGPLCIAVAIIHLKTRG
ncbi:uncharacterized protein LOC142004004 [Carettochelys insculpta]|uniref:uncharacterized protein LOC142004004 n=1 Tax=Carettochelys insculpta TaxID=44489 RepID=UPI003EC02A5C